MGGAGGWWGGRQPGPARWAAQVRWGRGAHAPAAGARGAGRTGGQILTASSRRRKGARAPPTCGGARIRTACAARS